MGSRTGCVVQAVATDPKNSVAWRNLGGTIPDGKTVRVNGESYGEQDCYVQALTLNPQFAVAWVNLAVTVERAFTDNVVIAGKSYTKQACKKSLQENLAYEKKPYLGSV